MPRKLGTGKIRKRPGAVHKELEEALIASYQRKVPCKICGRLDNDWPDRHGLCSDCFCGWLNGKFAMDIKLSDAMANVRRLGRHLDLGVMSENVPGLKFWKKYRMKKIYSWYWMF